MRSRLLVMFLVILVSMGVAEGFIKWFFGSQENGNTGHNSEAGSIPEQDVPFEMQTVDEKFLMEATDMTELDFCHHRVISELQSTCSDLSEEGLAKLSVQLLNCQLEAEERTTYTCTKDKTIAECTKEMDGTMWNAYQIVANRARAVCYSVRQHHFRMKTEYTVNKLVHNTEQQLEAMHRIQVSQEEINKLTGETMDELQISQKNLISQHDHMQASAAEMQVYIASNLQALTQEKALIATGNKELYQAIENIKKKIDEATDSMHKQETAQKNNHEAVLQDLAGIQDRARKVFDKINDSSKNILKYHEETTKQFQQTLENLQKLNKTVNYMLSVIFQLQEAFDTRMQWISDMLGGADNKVELVTTLVCHIAYFLLVAIMSSLLHTPVFSRLALLSMVPLNAWAQVRHCPSLSYTSMAAFMAIVILVNRVLGLIMSLWHSWQAETPTGTLVVAGEGIKSNLQEIQRLLLNLQVCINPGQVYETEDLKKELNDRVKDTEE